MNPLGMQLNLMAGPSVPMPIPTEVMDSLQRVEVIHQDDQRSGFQITFEVSRSAADLLDYSLVQNPQLQPFSRVRITVLLGLQPTVLMDGIITHHQLSPSNEPGNSLFTITGEDLSFVMNRADKTRLHPAQNDALIAAKLIGEYSKYGILPEISGAAALETPSPLDQIPAQVGTDYDYLQALAARHNFVFYLYSAFPPGSVVAYWGPRKRVGSPQPALAYHLGPHGNVESLNFEYDIVEPTLVEGQVQDRDSNQVVPVKTLSATETPLSRAPPALQLQSHTRRQVFRQTGLSGSGARTLAQATVNASTQAVVTASGEINALRYGSVLQARALVDVQGAGSSYSGTYYVNRVTHSITKGDYRQQFLLTREGLGALSPFVRPSI